MLFTTRATLVACLVPCIAAFYPYVESGSANPAAPSLAGSLNQRQTGQEGSLRMRIKCTPVRRDNDYKIISANVPTQPNSLGVDQDGTDYSYFSSFTFGTSKKTFHMLLDSGAGSSWVYGRNCTSDACKAHTALGVSDSSSLKVSSTPFAVTYGTGSVSGFLSTDTIHFASFNVPFTFGLASNASSEFFNYPMDGIIGLGRADVASSFNTMSSPTIVDVLSSQGLIQRKLYGISLWRDSDGGANNGEINFGAPDDSRYEGNVNYVAAVANVNGYWEIPLEDAAVDGKAQGVKGRTAIMDTGTSFLVIPPADAKQLHSLITGSAQNGERFNLPCSSTQTIQLKFGGVTYNIPPKDYIGKSTGSDGMCVSNIIGRQTFGANQWLVGAVFFKNVYTVFDYDGRVGFGVKGGNQATATAAAPSSSTTSGVVSAQDVASSSSMRPTSSTTSGMKTSSSTSSRSTSSPSTSSHSTSSSTAAPISKTSSSSLAIVPITTSSPTAATDATSKPNTGIAIIPVTTETSAAATTSPGSSQIVAPVSGDIGTAMPVLDGSSDTATANTPSSTNPSSDSTPSTAGTGDNPFATTSNSNDNNSPDNRTASLTPTSTDSSNAPATDSSNGPADSASSINTPSDSNAPSSNSGDTSAPFTPAGSSSGAADSSSNGTATDTTSNDPAAASKATPAASAATFTGKASVSASMGSLLSLSLAVLVAAVLL